MMRRNRKRAAKMYARNYGERGDPIRAMPCLIAARSISPDPTLFCDGAVEAAHVKARGMGGCGGDRRQLVPLCSKHHRAWGRMGRHTFSTIFQIDLSAEADRIALELDARGIP